jgi:succinate dehydrogenase flavin-adding protein (antitoxin of CptAB toxin-antitoxin module)
MIFKQAELNKVKWAARRGMLELDLILGPYVDQEYMLLPDKDKEAFLSLLECEDSDLFTWFLKSVPPSVGHNYMVNKILEFQYIKQKLLK